MERFQQSYKIDSLGSKMWSIKSQSNPFIRGTKNDIEKENRSLSTNSEIENIFILNINWILPFEDQYPTSKEKMHLAFVN